MPGLNLDAWFDEPAHEAAVPSEQVAAPECLHSCRGCDIVAGPCRTCAVATWTVGKRAGMCGSTARAEPRLPTRRARPLHRLPWATPATDSAAV